jgi:hypothetical protein
MRDAEAKALAQRIARLVARRWEVRSDLNDATDVAGAGGSVVSWIERVVSRQTEPSTIDRDVAPPPPRSGTVLLADENRPSEPIVDGPPPSVVDRDGNPVPGSGPAKAAFLEGFED